jgi:spore germination protein Q
MNYYYSYPYGPMPHPMSSGYRYQGSNYPTPPYPAGHHINAATPTGPAAANAQAVAQQTATQNMAQSQAITASVQEFLNATSGRGSGYMDHILNYNKGKYALVHMTFNSGGASAETKVFSGIIESAARDHLILSDPKTGHRYVLLMVYLDYVEFPEEINYYYPGTNVLKVVDEDFFENHPEVLPLYNYQNYAKETFLKNLESITPTTSTIQPY